MKRFTEQDMYSLESETAGVMAVNTSDRNRSDLGSMLHDLRTSLSVILSSSELVEHYGHKLTDGARIEYMKRIQQAVRMMVEVLNSIPLNPESKG